MIRANLAPLLACAAAITATVSSAAPAPRAMSGTAYPAAAHFVTRYCASCHTEGGRHRQQARGYHVVQLDSYAQFREYTKVITAVLDKEHLDGKIMPPAKAPAQPTDGERRLMLDWIGRGSPNSRDGH